MSSLDFTEYTFSNITWTVKQRYQNLSEPQLHSSVSVWYL